MSRGKTRARLRTAAHFCEAVVLKLRTLPIAVSSQVEIFTGEVSRGKKASVQNAHFTSRGFLRFKQDEQGQQIQVSPQRLHPAPHSPHPAPYTLHPSPYTLHLKPYTLHATPYTLHPSPFTLHPTPRTLHPTPYTLHPTPHTLHPKPVWGGGLDSGLPSFFWRCEGSAEAAGSGFMVKESGGRLRGPTP